MQNYIFIKTGMRCTKIDLFEIKYIESIKRYSKITTTKKPLLIYLPLSQVIQLLPPDIFLRVHKSFIISLHHTSDFENEIAYVAGKQIPIGRKYRGLLLKKVILLRGKHENDPVFPKKEMDDLIKKIKSN